MPTFFANPWGLLGLLAVPAILVIHMLREKSRRVRVSTLFLLERLPPRTPHGRSLHFHQSSLPLWLQLLAALLCTWLLADPRWVHATSFQSVVVILDSTASMSVCRERVRAELPGVLRDLGRLAGRTEWVVGTSDVAGGVLYRGSEVGEALAALDRWQPLLPHHDPAPAFATALANARGQGSILFVSDGQPEALPAGITLLAFGRPLENCGFAGLRTWRDVDGPHWEALVQNSGTAPQERDWSFEAGAIHTRPERLRLAAGQLQTLTGPFPPGEKHLRVRLTGDAFSLDDELPLVAPEPKPLAVFLSLQPPELAQLFDKALKTVPEIKQAASVQECDVAIVTAGDLDALPAKAWAIGLSGPTEPSRPSTLAAEAHPLLEGLVWDGLLSQGPGSRLPAPTDQTLLWQGEQPLIFLHPTGAQAQQLVINFDVSKSNADRLPAFVLLIGRFLSQAREAKSAHEAANFETGQALPLAPAAGLEIVRGALRVKAPAGVVTAPVQPGFFSVQAGGAEVLEAAAHFGDPREADFQHAISKGFDGTQRAAIRQLNSAPDPLAGVWLLLVAAALLGSWAAYTRSLRGGERYA